MAELGISVAEKLIEVIGSVVIKEICVMWGYKSELEGLQETVSTIKSVLLDAESKRELSNEEHSYIEKLKEAVYDADDLFDEFLTLAELNQLGSLSKRGKFFKKLRCFFSSKNQVSVAYRMSHQVKEIRKHLDAIANDHKKFGFRVNYRPIVRRREETCSYIDAKVIIGREHDKKVVIDMLLDNKVDHVQVLTIVGVGGCGKTTLAQLVYNDEKVKNEFPDHLRWWVCVSDQDGEKFEVKTILCKILEVVTCRNCGSSMELIQKQFQEQVRGKKYLLVLDDVWNEKRKIWDNLKQFLMLGQGRSRIIVTTRSERTATIIGNEHTYNLGGLTPKNSWRLFAVTTFIKGQDQKEHFDELFEIGKKIVNKCYNNPLAITVVGSLLYGQDINKWKSFEERGLAEISNGDNDIMSILKLSYHNLESPLKSCFTYCAIFPKDTHMNRDMLISLWMAQGYIMPFDRGQSIEDAAKEYFLILLRRCFFQDVEKDVYGDIKSVKIHDLMHDVAQEVGKEEICVTTSVANSLGDRVRHVNYVGDAYPESSFLNHKNRSFVYQCGYEKRSSENHVVIRELDNGLCLRVLDLKGVKLGGTSLCASVGKLLHLRYLNLSWNEGLEVLSESITELHNLQTLILACCNNLRELPKELSKLVKLRHLDLQFCDALTGMPSGMDKLIKLRVLPYFVVGKVRRDSLEQQCDGKLKDLKALTNIEGKICIRIKEGVEEMNDMEGGYLKSMQHLIHIYIQFKDSRIEDEALTEKHEAVMGKLEPHPNLKGFRLGNYKGKTIPRWGRAEDNWAVTLPHLVKIEFSFCAELEQIPSMSKLPYLKSLKLANLSKLEYMENASSRSSNNDAKATKLFFPSLESLELSNLKELKGWWREEGLDEDDHNLRRKIMRFPRISRLKISCCSNLTSFPACPMLEDLTWHENNEKLDIIENIKRDKEQDNKVKLRKVHIYRNVGCLKSMRSPYLTELSISLASSDGDESLSEIREVLRSYASSLQSLSINGCYRVTPLHKLGLDHLTSLIQLEIYNFDGEMLNDDENDNGMPWISLTSLQTLHISLCHNLKAIPEWISCLSSLQSLSISDCDILKSLPDSIRNLTSLQSLRIGGCSNLKQTCKEPDGADWPKIQHIPRIDIW